MRACEKCGASHTVDAPVARWQGQDICGPCARELGAFALPPGLPPPSRLVDEDPSPAERADLARAWAQTKGKLWPHKT